MNITEHQALRALVKDNFFEFVKEFWGEIIEEKPVFNWHIEYLCNELQEVAERVFSGTPKEYDLIINVPPGSTKSTICSQMYPAWVWTRMPSARFICASYAYMVAQKDSMRTRDLVQSETYQQCFPEISLREDENTKGLFTNRKRGSRLSAGIGGAVTGNHAHFLIVDDPINPEEAFSEAELRNANRWMESTLPTRKVDKLVTPTILVMQRLHEADPTGEMLERYAGSNTLKHICLPGEITDNVNPPELAQRYTQDGLLDPVRLPRQVLKQLEKTLGAYGYAGQILQDPAPLGGGMFKVDKMSLLKAVPNRLVRVVRSWDKAGTEDGGKYSAGVKMALDHKGNWGVIDVVRGQWGSTRREDMIRQTAELDGTNVEILLEIEGGSGGKESGENTVRNLAGFRVRTYHPTGDKPTRAYPMASQVGAGNVWCVQADWTKAFLDELRFFPRGKYSDQVDAAAAAFTRLARKPKRVGGMR